MSGTVLALLAALIGAAAALAGQALSPLIRSRKAHQQWLRDKRAEAFENFSATLLQHGEVGAVSS